MRFATTTAVCYTVDAHNHFNYVSKWSKATNDAHVKPYVYGWAAFWDYNNLASFGNYQMYDYDGDWTVERTGDFKFHFGISSFAITHHIQLSDAFSFTPDGWLYWQTNQ